MEIVIRDWCNPNHIFYFIKIGFDLFFKSFKLIWKILNFFKIKKKNNQINIEIYKSKNFKLQKLLSYFIKIDKILFKLNKYNKYFCYEKKIYWSGSFNLYTVK